MSLSNLPGTDRVLRFGLVGGRFGASFPWNAHPNLTVAAVAERNPSRREFAQKKYECAKGYETIEELVRDPEIDAVGVYTDAPLHVEHSILAMEHGKHVLCAVPACFGSIEEGERLLEAVERTGMNYMLAETGYYQQHTISARKFYEEGAYGDLYFCEAEYQHAGLEELFVVNGERTWRYGFPPMYYPTHATSLLIGVSGERLVEVMCCGWGDDDPVVTDNVYGNPFWNECAAFRTGRGNLFRANIWWKGAHAGCERADWTGSKLSFHCAHPNGLGARIVREGTVSELDDGGFKRAKAAVEEYTVPKWWNTDMLPEPMRIASGHQGSHVFLITEFVHSVLEERRPAIDVYEALAYTVPGIIAHQSAMKDGETLKVPQYDRK
jgi:predicted dehydrogenase